MSVRKRSMLELVLCLACLVGFACGEANRQITPPAATASQPAVTSQPASSSIYKVEWSSPQIPGEMLAGTTYDVTATIKNTSDQTWPSQSPSGWTNVIVVSYHWLPADGPKPVVWDGTRTPFPKDIAPGESITMNKIRVTAPPSPGAFRLQLSLVNEGVVWFEAHGGTTVIVPVTVR